MNQEKKESEEITWTDSEVEELVQEMKEIKDQAIDEAVKVAVIPLIAENEVLKLNAKNKMYDSIKVGVVTGFVAFIAGYFLKSIIDDLNGGV